MLDKGTQLVSTKIYESRPETRRRRKRRRWTRRRKGRPILSYFKDVENGLRNANVKIGD